MYALLVVLGPLLQPCGVSPPTTGAALAAFSALSVATPLLYLWLLPRSGARKAYMRDQARGPARGVCGGGGGGGM